MVFLDETHVLPIRLAMKGARFRIPLEKEYIDKTALPVYEFFLHYLPRGIVEKRQISFLDSQGNPIDVQIVKPPHTISLSEEKVEYSAPAFILKEWFHSQKFYHKDHILVTIEDWEQGIVRLERERFGELRAELLAERNQAIADALYAMLDSSKYQDLYVSEALPTIYARMPEKSGYPPDHFMVITNNDPRMVTTGWTITYADGDNAFLKSVLAETDREESLAAHAPEYT